jgi:hypothetical protein
MNMRPPEIVRSFKNYLQESLDRLAPDHRLLLYCAIFFGLLASRRWAQWISPQVWNEEGAPEPLLNAGSLLPDYIHFGWRAFFMPVNDYLFIVPKTISGLALTLSFSHYPFISTIISWLFITLVALAITYCPTHLKGKALCAISLFLVPCDPEVFGLTSYTFWWASLLLFLIALWDEMQPLTWLRLVLLSIAGLSTPVIVLVLPLLYVRAWLYRQRRGEIVIAVVATAISAVQLFFILHGVASGAAPLRSALTRTLPTFLGRFLLSTENIQWQWAAALFLLLTICYWVFWNRRSLTVWSVVYLLFGSIALVVARVDPAILHPQLAGPRYFFFPFVLLGWILIQCYHSTRSVGIRVGVILFGGLALGGAVRVWSRTHDDLNWVAHVRSCAVFQNYTVPIQCDGHLESAWSLKLTGKQCKQLLDRELISAPALQSDHSTFPFTTEKIVAAEKPRLSRVTRVTGAEALSMRTRRGSRIVFRTGGLGKTNKVTIAESPHEFLTQLPIARNWIVLEFSNSKLPEEFTVEFAVTGGTANDWLETAFEEIEGGEPLNDLAE